MPSMSKVKDPRFWEKWRNAGAVGTMPIKLRVDFNLYYIDSRSLSEAKDHKVDFLVAEEWDMVPPKWEEGESYEEYQKKPMGYTEEPMVHTVYLLNLSLLPLILKKLAKLGWGKREDRHGYPIFHPGKDKTHDGLIRKLAEIGEVNDLLMQTTMPHREERPKRIQRFHSEFPECPNPECEEPGRVGPSGIGGGAEHGGDPFYCYSCCGTF